ncbi:MAG: peptidoglycan-associated lipoprotein [Deltaproteobacteria bacterium HGW-Deltaproteobacteria-2]|jgi:peptidoglycan-associated lipoprotein|nr:MAG: peptidoglycan-associated lipoprotein [Deltaproteobacteria bacterium HGW-Deltaproteobacteria-2]
MKKILTLIGIFVVIIFGLTIFTGCAEKKSVVTSGSAQEQQVAPAPTPAQIPTDTTKQSDSTDAPTGTTNIQETANEQSSLMEATAKSPISDINFDYDSSSIRPDAREILKTNADYLLKHKTSLVVVEGHCDERGTAEYNMALGQKRAQETKKFLVNLGIQESIIKTVSYGEERPLDPNNNEEAWDKNRRAHFVVTP